MATERLLVLMLCLAAAACDPPGTIVLMCENKYDSYDATIGLVTENRIPKKLAERFDVMWKVKVDWLGTDPGWVPYKGQEEGTHPNGAPFFLGQNVPVGSPAPAAPMGQLQAQIVWKGSDAAPPGAQADLIVTNGEARTSTAFREMNLGQITYQPRAIATPLPWKLEFYDNRCDR